MGVKKLLSVRWTSPDGRMRAEGPSIYKIDDGASNWAKSETIFVYLDEDLVGSVFRSLHPGYDNQWNAFFDGKEIIKAPSLVEACEAIREALGSGPKP